MSTITTITLTYNEEKNIGECIQSFENIADRIVVLDGCSTDNTVAIAKEKGAEVYQKDCGYYERFTYGMESLMFNTDWILFIDADERMTKESCSELKYLCDRYVGTDVNGIVVNYRVQFMGKELKHGGSILHKLRVFVPEKAFMEDIKLDQHIRLKEGKMVRMKSFLLHKDYKGLQVWSAKHVRYAELAAEDYLLKNEKEEKVEMQGLEWSAYIKRLIKYQMYYRLPMGIRAKLFYVYRYYFRLGFLDGKEGKIYTYLHAYWYRYLVDALIYEKQKEIKK